MGFFSPYALGFWALSAIFVVACTNPAFAADKEADIRPHAGHEEVRPAATDPVDIGGKSISVTGLLQAWTFYTSELSSPYATTAFGITWRPALRADWLDDGVDLQADGVLRLTAGLSIRPYSGVRIQVDYERSEPLTQSGAKGAGTDTAVVNWQLSF